MSRKFNVCVELSNHHSPDPNSQWNPPAATLRLSPEPHTLTVPQSCPAYCRHTWNNTAGNLEIQILSLRRTALHGVLIARWVGLVS